MTPPHALLNPASVPASLSRFFGRGREIAAVGEFLERSRLLTLTGAGGSGKTRLAAEVVGRVAHRWDRVVWVDLAPAADVNQLVNRVAGGFGLTERTQGAALDGIRQLVANQALLLVLDNCEHLIDVCAELADQLLRDLPGLTILATSRGALGVEGETAWLVPPLDPTEAATLFVERARAVHPAFSAGSAAAEHAIGEICRRLDGMPLAIELAAARVKVLTVEQIADRLGDALKLLAGGNRTALPRHRTLRSTIEWSVALLADQEQVLLRRLAVFPASFTLEAAEAVATDESLDAGAVLDALSGLVDKSLLVLDASEADARYRLLETVRQFATERMVAANEACWLARRHAEHYLAVAERHAFDIFGGARPAVLARMLPDSSNFRVAVEWSAGGPERLTTGLRFVWALHWFWWARGPFEEVQKLRRALPELETAADVPVEIRVRALIAFCMMACWQGWLDEGLHCGTAALRLLDEEADLELTAIALTIMGAALTLTGDLDGAVAYLERAAPLGRDHSRTNIGGIANHFLGVCRYSRGDTEGAWRAFEAQKAILTALGQEHGWTHALSAQAGIRYDQGDVADASAQFRDALHAADASQNLWGVAKGIEGIAICLAAVDPERSARLLGAAEALRERIAFPRWVDEEGRYAVCLGRLRDTLGERFAGAWAAGRRLTSAEATADAQAASTSAPARVPLSSVGDTGRAEPMADLVVRALGPLEIIRRGEPVASTAWGSARPRELLVFLLCHPGGVSKEVVGAALWPDASPTQLRNNFHVTLHRLRKALGDADWIHSANDTYRLDPAASVEFDAERFEHEVRVGLGALKRRDPAGPPALASALARYRGSFLEQEPAGDWADDHRERLTRIAADGGLAYGRWLTDAGRHEEAEAVLRAVTARDALLEDAWVGLMKVHARLGDRTRALRIYQQLEAVLAGELETEPGPDARDLRDRIERGDAI